MKIKGDNALNDRLEVHDCKLDKIPETAQIEIIIQIIRWRVTTALYLKCNLSASKRSTPIAVMVKNDAPQRNEIKMLKSSQSFREKDGGS